MFSPLLNWKLLLLIIALAIVSGTIVYSQYLAQQIAAKERQQVEAWAEAERTILNTTDSASINLNLATKIATENKDIPIIETDANNIPTGNFVNLNELTAQQNPNYLQEQLTAFIAFNNKPIELTLNDSAATIIRYYYGESSLLREVKWYPIVQLLVVALFIIIAFFSLQTSYRSNENLLWASMAKETAHQLGTPVSSLEGWLEILKEKKENATIVPEIAKDINRLLLITDRFGKIGSTPKLEMSNPVNQVIGVVDYMKKRSSERVQFSIDTGGAEFITAMLSPTLFNWVFENLLKNSLDALEGNGVIDIKVEKTARNLTIDVTDNGKGIQPSILNKVFKPGFTTKKRGWGIGLSLSKRIMEQYHKGKLYIKWSELGKGTTFSIILPLPVNLDRA